ncbi:MAG: type IVB secretion system apparatus protein IcmL/DotI [Alphaproteobacteria bacterium]|nr:type IVB secretion system apparatus protein IcmL/DotI [Alphaproteobacteria bacterium]OIN86178.1 MAG: type IV secretion protein IcmL [Alphaproteobacteria bacterium CG1_02_46_17]
MANPPNKSPNPRNIRPSEQAAAQSSSKKEESKDKSSAPRMSDAENEVEMLKSVGSVIVRNEFYRDGYRSILRIAVIEAIIILALIGAMYFIIEVHQPENRYFATTEDGRLIPATALSEPNLSVPALMSWSAQAATEVMTFGFNDYKRRLQEASRNFTRTGWASFTKALERSRIIEMVEANQQVVYSTPSSAPILVSEGEVNGVYQWEVDVPLVVTYQSGSNVRSDRLLVKLIIVRVPKLESPNGVAIEQWLAQ